MMSRERTGWIAVAALLLCVVLSAEARPSLAASCPAPAAAAQQSCRAIAYKDLPREAAALLKSSGCDVAAGSNYDYGVSVALGGDAPAYQFCCHEAAHGPCGAIILGQDKGQWRVLAKDILGYDADPPCDALVVLDHQSNGFHDLCIPNMAPPIRVFENGSYRAPGGH
jgi:hypothetical protein